MAPSALADDLLERKLMLEVGKYYKCWDILILVLKLGKKEYASNTIKATWLEYDGKIYNGRLGLDIWKEI